VRRRIETGQGRGRRIHHRSESGIITERFITERPPIRHADPRARARARERETLFEYPADVYLYISA